MFPKKNLSLSNFQVPSLRGRHSGLRAGMQRRCQARDDAKGAYRFQQMAIALNPAKLAVVLHLC